MTTFYVEIKADHYLCAIDTYTTIATAGDAEGNTTRRTYKYLYHDKFILLGAGTVEDIYRLHGALCDIADGAGLRADRIIAARRKLEWTHLFGVAVPFTQRRLDVSMAVLTEHGAYAIDNSGVTLRHKVGSTFTGGSGSTYIRAYESACEKVGAEFDLRDAMYFTSQYDPYTSPECDVLHVYHCISEPLCVGGNDNERNGHE